MAVFKADGDKKIELRALLFLFFIYQIMYIRLGNDDLPEASVNKVIFAKYVLSIQYLTEVINATLPGANPFFMSTVQ